MTLLIPAAFMVSGCAIATPQAATDPSATGVTLQANVSSSEAEATYWFEYGKTSAYGSATPKRTIELEDQAEAVSEPLTGLSPDTSYHFRACASTKKRIPRV